jgi:hypothetical protein
MSSTYLIPGAQERAAAELRNAVLAQGLMGATVGFALGLAGGLVRRSARGAAIAALLGLYLGSAAGACAALGAVPLAAHIQQRDPGNMSVEMTSSLLAHGITWAAVGAIGGLSFGIGLGSRAAAARGLLGGLVGAVAGAFLYEIIGALVLPGARIRELVANTWDIRLLASLLAIIPVAVGIAVVTPFKPTGSMPTDRSETSAAVP